MAKSDAERLADKLDGHPYDIGGAIGTDLMADVRIAAALLRTLEKELSELRCDAARKALGT